MFRVSAGRNLNCQTLGLQKTSLPGITFRWAFRGKRNAARIGFCCVYQTFDSSGQDVYTLQLQEKLSIPLGRIFPVRRPKAPKQLQTAKGRTKPASKIAAIRMAAVSSVQARSRRSACLDLLAMVGHLVR